MNINLLLSRITYQSPSSITPEIKTALSEIKEYAEKNYSDLVNAGKAALNRRMLLDPYIAERLTAEVIHYLFTHEPDTESQLQRPGDKTALAEIISFGLGDGLSVLKYMSNNNANYSYQEQQARYETNTLNIVKNIWQASVGLNKAFDDVLFQEFIQSQTLSTSASLTDQFDHIASKIAFLKKQDLSNALLALPRWAADDMRSQVAIGFSAACGLVQCDLNTETMHTFCEKFLSSPNAPIDQTVGHYFYDRAHLEAAIEQDTPIKFKDGTYHYRDILRTMLTLIDQNKIPYSAAAKEQFQLRLMLVEQDLRNRFTKTLIPSELIASATTADRESSMAISIETDASNALITLKECMARQAGSLPVSTEISDIKDMLLDYADAIKIQLPILSSSIEKLCLLVQKELASQKLTGAGEDPTSTLLNSYEFYEQAEFNDRNIHLNQGIKASDLCLLLRATVNFLVTPSSKLIVKPLTCNTKPIGACLEEIESGRAAQKKLMDAIQTLSESHYPPKEIAFTAEEASIVQTLWTLIEKLSIPSDLPLSAPVSATTATAPASQSMLDLSGFGSDGTEKKLSKHASMLTQKKSTQRDRLPSLSEMAIKDMLKAKLDLVALQLGEDFLIAVEAVLEKTQSTFSGFMGDNPTKMTQDIQALYENAKSFLPDAPFGDRLLYMYKYHSVYFSKLNAILRDEDYQGPITKDERELAFLLHVAQLKAGFDKQKDEMQTIPVTLHRGDKRTPEGIKQKYDSLRILQTTGCLTLGKEQLAHLDIADFFSKKNLSMTSDASQAQTFSSDRGCMLHLQNPEKISHFYSMGDVNITEQEFITRLKMDVVLLPVRLYEKNGVMHVDVFAIQTDELLDKPQKYELVYQELKQLIADTIVPLRSMSGLNDVLKKVLELQITFESDDFIPKHGVHSIISVDDAQRLFKHLQTIMELAVKTGSLEKLQALNQKMSDFVMTFGHQFKISHAIPLDKEAASRELKNFFSRLNAFLKRWRKEGGAENPITQRLDSLVALKKNENQKEMLRDVMIIATTMEYELNQSASLKENFPKLSDKIQRLKSIVKRISPSAISSVIPLSLPQSILSQKVDTPPPSIEEAEQVIQSNHLESTPSSVDNSKEAASSSATGTPVMELAPTEIQVKDLVSHIRQGLQGKALALFLSQNRLTIFTRYQGKSLLEHALIQDPDGVFSQYFDKKSDPFLKQCFADNNEQMDLSDAIAQIKERYLTSVGIELQTETSILNLAQKSGSKEATLLLKWLFVAHVKALLIDGKHSEALKFFLEHHLSLFDKDDLGSNLMKYIRNGNQNPFSNHFKENNQVMLCEQYQKHIGMLLNKEDHEQAWVCFDEARSLLFPIQFTQLFDRLMSVDKEGLLRKRKTADDIVRAGLPSAEDAAIHLSQHPGKVQELIVSALLTHQESLALDLLMEHKKVCIFDRMPQFGNRTLLDYILATEGKGDQLSLLQRTFSPPSAQLVDQYLRCNPYFSNNSLNLSDIQSLLAKQYTDFDLILNDGASVLSKLIPFPNQGSTFSSIKIWAFDRQFQYLIGEERVDDAIILLQSPDSPLSIFSPQIENSIPILSHPTFKHREEHLKQAIKHVSKILGRNEARLEFLMEIVDKKIYHDEELIQLYDAALALDEKFGDYCQARGWSRPAIDKASNPAATASASHYRNASHTFFQQNRVNIDQSATSAPSVAPVASKKPE